MAQKIFTYITYKDGVPDDSALELVEAARQLGPETSPTAVAIGSGIDNGFYCSNSFLRFALAPGFALVTQIRFKQFADHPVAVTVSGGR